MFSVAVRTLQNNLDRLQDSADAPDSEIDFLSKFLSNPVLQSVVEVISYCLYCFCNGLGEGIQKGLLLSAGYVYFNNLSHSYHSFGQYKQVVGKE